MDELKQIQLEMLMNIDKFCRTNSIRYSLAYGSLLGAARHKGYIPWDDDIDICMPRPDYEKFIHTYTDEKSRYKCYCSKTYDSFKLPFAKVSDERTVMVESMYEKDAFGIYVDVFPVDAMGSKMQIFKSKWLNRFLNSKKAVLGQRSILKDIVICIGKIVLYPISVRKILSWMEAVATEYRYDETPVCEIFCSSTVDREIVPTDYFNHYRTLQFEGIEFSVVDNFDGYLTALYGNWRQIPPIEKRVSSHVFKAWWK